MIRHSVTQLRLAPWLNQKGGKERGKTVALSLFNPPAFKFFPWMLCESGHRRGSITSAAEGGEEGGVDIIRLLQQVAQDDTSCKNLSVR